MTAVLWEGWGWTCPLCGYGFETEFLAQLTEAVELHVQGHEELFVIQTEKFLSWKAGQR